MLTTEAAGHQATAVKATADQEQTTRRAAEVLSGQIKTAMNAWVEQQKAKDPDFDRKISRIRKDAKAYAEEHGHPQSAIEAVALMDKVYIEINELMTPPTPPVKPTAKTPDGMSGNAPTTAKPAKTLTEALLAV